MSMIGSVNQKVTKTTDRGTCSQIVSFWRVTLFWDYLFEDNKDRLFIKIKGMKTQSSQTSFFQKW